MISLLTIFYLMRNLCIELKICTLQHRVQGDGLCFSKWCTKIFPAKRKHNWKTRTPFSYAWNLVNKNNITIFYCNGLYSVIYLNNSQSKLSIFVYWMQHLKHRIHVLCILTSYWVLPAPVSWSKHLLWPFSIFFSFQTLFSDFSAEIKKKCLKIFEKTVF